MSIEMTTKTASSFQNISTPQGHPQGCLFGGVEQSFSFITFKLLRFKKFFSYNKKTND